jgi:hypothetical protein
MKDPSSVSTYTAKKVFFSQHHAFARKTTTLNVARMSASSDGFEYSFLKGSIIIPMTTSLDFRRHLTGDPDFVVRQFFEGVKRSAILMLGEKELHARIRSPEARRDEHMIVALGTAETHLDRDAPRDEKPVSFHQIEFHR